MFFRNLALELASGKESFTKAIKVGQMVENSWKRLELTTQSLPAFEITGGRKMKTGIE
jgi:hypothetical protein